MLWPTPGAELSRQMPQRADAGRTAPDVSSAELMRQVSELQRELQARVAEARQQGRQEGEAQGRAMASAAVAPVIDRMTRALQELTEMRAKLRKQAAEDLVQLAVAIARRVVHRECSVDPSTLEGMVRAALDRLDRQETYRVLVHPSQAEPIRRALEAATTRSIEVVPVASAEPGALLFETSRGKLDAGVETQLREIERGLAAKVSR